MGTETGHRLHVKDKTTRESAGSTNRFKHDVSFGIWYRQIEIHAPPPPANAQKGPIR